MSEQGIQIFSWRPFFFFANGHAMNLQVTQKWFESGPSGKTPRRHSSVASSILQVTYYGELITIPD
jgi:hypothetical protein